MGEHMPSRRAFLIYLGAVAGATALAFSGGLNFISGFPVDDSLRGLTTVPLRDIIDNPQNFVRKRFYTHGYPQFIKEGKYAYNNGIWGSGEATFRKFDLNIHSELQSSKITFIDHLSNPYAFPPQNIDRYERVDVKLLQEGRGMLEEERFFELQPGEFYLHRLVFTP